MHGVDVPIGERVPQLTLSLKESPARRDRFPSVDKVVLSSHSRHQKTSQLLGIGLKQFNISGLDFTEFIRGFALVSQFSFATDG